MLGAALRIRRGEFNDETSAMQRAPRTGMGVGSEGYAECARLGVLA
jgi:hypothetical protein